MKINADIYVKDVPGTLVSSLEPISTLGGNIVGVVHNRDTMDNNTAERMIRSLTIIRKNSLFTGSEKGGNTLAVLYSFAKTCQANKVSFRKWLEDVLVRIGTTPESELNTLLPHNWSQQTA